MKVAKMEPFVVDVYCPYCKELSEHPNGSYQWEIRFIEQNKIYGCSECGLNFRLPKRIHPGWRL